MDKLSAVQLVKQKLIWAFAIKARHSYNDKRTARTEVMYRHGGTIYVHLIYGMYEMLNIITQTEGVPEGVMIRSAFLNSASTKKEYKLLAGPGNLTRYLGIDRTLKGQTLGEESGLWIEAATTQPEVVLTPRIELIMPRKQKTGLNGIAGKIIHH